MNKKIIFLVSSITCFGIIAMHKDESLENGIQSMTKYYEGKKKIKKGSTSNDASQSLIKSQVLNGTYDAITKENLKVEEDVDTAKKCGFYLNNGVKGSFAGVLGCAVTGMPIMGIVVSHTIIPGWAIYVPIGVGSVLGCCAGIVLGNK